MPSYLIFDQKGLWQGRLPNHSFQNMPKRSGGSLQSGVIDLFIGGIHRELRMPGS
jgi:hypothetical protein